MKIIIGSDHGGFPLKEEIRNSLVKEGFDVRDYGTYSTDAVDYPDIALLVAEAVAKEKDNGTLGIMIDGVGVASAICCNKVRGIRAACCNDMFSARNAKEHNDANILTMGGRVVGGGTALEIVRIFTGTPFSGGRHSRRVEKMMQIEKKYFKE